MAARDVTNEQFREMSQDERRVWLASMDEDEALVVNIANGNWHELVWAAYCKRAVGTPMAAAERLQMLEFIESAGSQHVDIAAVEPASDDLVKIVHEARSLNPEPDPDAVGPTDQASFEMLTSWECRWHILRVQPSLLEALRLSHSRQRAPSP